MIPFFYQPRYPVSLSQILDKGAKIFLHKARRSLLAILFLGLSFNIGLCQESVLDKVVSLPKQKATVYEVLNQISSATGCYFIYDSRLIENDRKVRTVAEPMSLKALLNQVLEDPNLEYSVIGKHILISHKPRDGGSSGRTDTVRINDSAGQIIIKGIVRDKLTRDPLPFASVGVAEGQVGTVTNSDGYFTLRLPQKYLSGFLLISHLGYLSQQIPVSLMDQQEVLIELDRRVISIQEVLIRYIDPLSLITKSIDQRKVNNSHDPVYLTSFYREGVYKNDRIINFSEAIFLVYKSSYEYDEAHDQVKLLKSRKIQNLAQDDTVQLKLKAGILTGLQLDIMKTLPDFLEEEFFMNYDYTYSDLLSYNEKDVFALTFKPKPERVESIYSGTLYIDKDNFALLGADFRIDDSRLEKAAWNLVQKKSRKLIVKFVKATYSVNYSNYNGKYYLNHIRSDLHIRTRLRGHFSGDDFHTFLEIATCKIDTVNVTRFSKQEELKPGIIFSDRVYTYDDDFWGMYNTITPETKLNEALSRIRGMIEETR
jgi:hypothetical protein